MLVIYRFAAMAESADALDSGNAMYVKNQIYHWQTRNIQVPALPAFEPQLADALPYLLCQPNLVDFTLPLSGEDKIDAQTKFDGRLPLKL